MFKLFFFFWTLAICYSLKASGGPQIPIEDFSGSKTLDGEGYDQNLCNKKIVEFFKNPPFKNIDFRITEKNNPNKIQILASAIELKASRFSGEELIKYSQFCNVLEDKNKIHPELYARYNPFEDSLFRVNKKKLLLYSLDRASIKKWILSSIEGENEIPVLDRKEIKKDLQNDFIEGLKISMDSKALIDENKDLEKYLKPAIIDSILNLDKEIFISEIYKKSKTDFLNKLNPSDIFFYTDFSLAEKNAKTFDIHIGITRTSLTNQSKNLVTLSENLTTKTREAQSSSGALDFVNEILSIQTQMQGLKEQLSQLDPPIDISEKLQKIADYLAIAQNALSEKEKAQKFVDAAKVEAENAQAAENSQKTLEFLRKIQSIKDNIKNLQTELSQLDLPIDISAFIQKVEYYLTVARDSLLKKQMDEEEAQAIEEEKAQKFVDAAKTAAENAQDAAYSSISQGFVDEIKKLKNELSEYEMIIDKSDFIKEVEYYLAKAQEAYEDLLNKEKKAKEKAVSESAKLLIKAKTAAENAKTAQYSFIACSFIEELLSIQEEMSTHKTLLTQLSRFDSSIDISDITNKVKKAKEYLAEAQEAYTALVEDEALGKARAIEAVEKEANEIVAAAKIASENAQNAQTVEETLRFVEELQPLIGRLESASNKLVDMGESSLFSLFQEVVRYRRTAVSSLYEKENALGREEQLKWMQTKINKLVADAKTAAKNAQRAENSSKALRFVKEIKGIQDLIENLAEDFEKFNMNISRDVEKVKNSLQTAQKAAADKLLADAKKAAQEASKLVSSNKSSSYPDTVTILKNLLPIENEIKTIQFELNQLEQPIDIATAVQEVSKSINQVKKYIETKVSTQTKELDKRYEDLKGLVAQFENQNQLPGNFYRIAVGIKIFNRIFDGLKNQIDFYKLGVDISEDVQKTNSMARHIEAIEKRFKAKRRN